MTDRWAPTPYRLARLKARHPDAWPAPDALLSDFDRARVAEYAARGYAADDHAPYDVTPALPRCRACGGVAARCPCPPAAVLSPAVCAVFEALVPGSSTRPRARQPAPAAPPAPAPPSPKDEAGLFDAPDLVWIDTETTGTQPEVHQVIELAAVQTGPDGAAERRRACRKVRLEPWARVDPRALAVSGYDPRAPAWAAVARPLREVLEAFARWLPAPAVLAGHNVAFDVRMLRGCYARAGVTAPPALDGPTLCTMALGRRALGAGALAALCDRLGVPNARAHTALGDVERAIAVYRALRAREPAQLALGGAA